MVLVEKDAYKSMVVKCEEKDITISEGKKIEFICDSTGEKKVGILNKISGKGEKTKIQIMPKDAQCEEVWSITAIEEDTLKLYVEE